MEGRRLVRRSHCGLAKGSTRASGHPDPPNDHAPQHQSHDSKPHPRGLLDGDLQENDRGNGHHYELRCTRRAWPSDWTPTTVPRPGFNYGFGHEALAGGGYPSYSHIQRIVTEGTVPLLKLHGSVSWSLRNGKLVRYHDCRPAVRGDALLVAPVRGKRPPDALVPTWRVARAAVTTARLVLIVGYSLPPYDDLVRDLLAATATNASIHVFDPDPRAGERYRHQLHREIVQHGGLPEALPDVARTCEAAAQ